jgi:hypothetical protein
MEEGTWARALSTSASLLLLRRHIACWRNISESMQRLFQRGLNDLRLKWWECDTGKILSMLRRGRWKLQRILVEKDVLADRDQQKIYNGIVIYELFEKRAVIARKGSRNEKAKALDSWTKLIFSHTGDSDQYKPLWQIAR